MRQEIFRRAFDPRRNIADECGHPRDGELTAERYQELYDRDPLAARVVEFWPRESWQVQPTVYEEEDSDTATEFEEAWDALGKQLRGERSAYQDEHGSPLWKELLLADILSGVGQYGVIFLGLDDGRPPNEPAAGVEESYSVPGGRGEVSTTGGAYSFSVNARRKGRKLIYLCSFPEVLAPISRFETNPSSPRFGMPVEYQLTFEGWQQSTTGNAAPPGRTVTVHWTRIIHVADRWHQASSSKVFGVPRMRPVLNRLLDLQKLYGGSAEMYWRGAFPGYTLETDPTLGGDVQFDKDAAKDMMEQYMNGLQRYLVLNGLSMKGQAPQVVDPTAQIAAQIEAVCIKLDVPLRIFKGSERGELASSQDERAHKGRVRGRQCNYLTPGVVVPFTDRLILLGVLPEPEGYSVDWPDVTEATALEKADLAAKRTDAVVKYVSGGAEALIGPMDYLTRFLDFTEEEAETILENAAEHQEERQEEEALQQEEQIARGLAPDPQAGGAEGGAFGEEEEDEDAVANLLGNHLPGKHDQKRHGNRGGRAPAGTRPPAPAPQPSPPGGGRPARAPDDPATANLRAGMRGTLERGLGRSRGLSDEQRREYAADTQAIIDRLPPAALRRAAGAIDSATYHADPGKMTKALSKRYAEIADDAAEGYTLGGLYVGGNAKELHLDGAFGKGGPEKETRQELYAHEIGHAIDGPRGELSSRGGWRSAWQSEIGRGGLSNYARESASEGFAEFARVVYATGTSHDTLRQRFPKSYAFWQENGLL